MEIDEGNVYPSVLGSLHLDFLAHAQHGSVALWCRVGLMICENCESSRESGDLYRPKRLQPDCHDFSL